MGSIMWLVMMAVFLLPVIIRLITENRRGKPSGGEPKEKKTRIFDEVSAKMKSKAKKITIGVIIAAAAVVIFVMCQINTPGRRKDVSGLGQKEGK